MPLRHDVAARTKTIERFCINWGLTPINWLVGDFFEEGSDLVPPLARKRLVLVGLLPVQGFLEGLESFLLLLVQAHRRLDHHPNHQVTATGSPDRLHALAPQAKQMTSLSTRGHPKRLGAIQSGYFDLGSQRGCGESLTCLASIATTMH